jgi:NTP pyrophosphatase (non-canonical NTP hydrolase)
MTTTIIKEVFKASDDVKNDRTLQDVLTHLMTEVGELALEIQIQEGKSYKTCGEDGVIGEAIDVIVCALDIIKLNNPNIREDYDIYKIVDAKLKKWKEHANEISS